MTAPILLPRESDARFAFAPSGVTESSPVRLPRHRRPSFASWDGPAKYVAIEYDAAWPTLYRSRALGWEGVVYATREDEPRLLHALHLAEIGILFVAVLAEVTGGGGRGALLHLADCVREKQAERVR